LVKITGEEKTRLEREAFSADNFITGSNAIILDEKKYEERYEKHHYN
jgi:hypothetical protein